MIPVFQVEHGYAVEEPGDCVRACVASILHLQLRDVPHFVKRRHIHECINEDWEELLFSFFEEYGYYAYWGEKWKWDYTGNYSIGYGYICDREDWAHAVVCWNGTIVHDPSNEWELHSVPYYINLETL